MFPMPKIIMAVVAVAGIQTAALGWMIYDRIALIRSGKEIILPIIPVDPRSLFRGDYVQLSYTITQLPASLLEGQQPAPGSKFFVTLAPEEGPAWKAIRITAAHPGKVADGQIVLAARTRRWQLWSGTIWAHYGIERYYVPETKGLELEKMVGQKKLAAAISVDSSGRTAIKGLAVEGKLIYDEPLF